MRDFLAALGLLTILPVRPQWDDGTQASLWQPGRAMAWYPLVGALIGGIVAAAALGLTRGGVWHRAPLLSAALTLAAWVVLTGALHLDGWADCCDAFFVPVDRARRLEIMKDPRLGSFGGVGLLLLVLVKLGALSASAGNPAVFVLAPALARWVLVVAAAGFPLAKQEGMAAFFRRSLGRREVVIATTTAALLLAISWRWGGSGLLVLPISAVLAMLAMAGLATRRLGGLTGDVYGAIVELAETVTLIAAIFVVGS
jgi:adenosylcobinamide-GDP ribazoletransferase